MKWIEKHLNITYGIAAALPLIALLVVYLLNGGGRSMMICFVAWYGVATVGGLILEKTKNNWIGANLGCFGRWILIILLPPIYMLAVLCAKNKKN